MRLPAVAIAAAFASGILLGLHPAVARNAASSLLLSILFVGITVLLLSGILFVRIGRLVFAVGASLLSWAMLGLLGFCIAEQPRDEDHVIPLMERGQLPVRSPLRWHGKGDLTGSGPRSMSGITRATPCEVAFALARPLAR